MEDGMKCNLKNRMFVAFIIGFGFIVFNGMSFAGDNGGISQKEQSGLEAWKISTFRKIDARPIRQ